MRHSVEGRLQRALAMLAWLDGRDPVPIADLCERFSVSPHQLRKDVIAIQTMAPGDDPLLSPVIHIDEEAQTVELEHLPSVLGHAGRLSRAESFAALAVGRAALELLDDDDAPHLASALEKLEGALEEGRQLAVDIDEPGHLDAVRAAAAEHRTIEIDYWSAWRDELSTRRVDPLRAFYAKGEWYLTCHDHHSGELRHFRIDRIIGCRETTETFEPYEIDPSLEAFTAPKILATEVLVRFPATASWVPEYVAGTVSDEDDDGYRMRLTSVGESWLARLLLRTGGEVVEPADLVDLRRSTAQRILDLYRPPGSDDSVG